MRLRFLPSTWRSGIVPTNASDADARQVNLNIPGELMSYKKMPAMALVICSFGMFAAQAFGQTCTLLGKEATLAIVVPGFSANYGATVQPAAVEFNPVPGESRFAVDIESNSVRMANISDSTNVGFSSNATWSVVMSGPSVPTITGISVAVNGVTNMPSNHVTFTGNSVIFDASDSVWAGGNDVVATLQLSCPSAAAATAVPTTSSRGLLMLGSLVLLAGLATIAGVARFR